MAKKIIHIALCRCKEVAAVDRFKKDSMYGLSPWIKRSCREVTVIGGSTVFTLHINLKPTSRNMVYFAVKNGCSKSLLNFLENAP